MSFNESARFPLEIAFGAQGGPGYMTNIVPMDSGFENRNSTWINSRARYEVGSRVMRASDTAALIAFFRAVKGRAYGFRFRDWSDYQVSGAEGVLIQFNGALYLGKKYTSGDLTELRLINKPSPGTVTLSGGGSVDYTTGIVTGAAPTDTWFGQFDIPARFDTDDMKLDAIDKSQGEILFQWGSIPIVEIRV